MTNDELMYKALKRINNSHISGENFDQNKVFDLAELGITKQRCELLIEHIAKSGFVEGINVIPILGKEFAWSVNKPRLTALGLSFLDACEAPPTETIGNPVTFNIHGGSFSGNTNFGNQEHATINIGATIEDLEKLKSTLSLEDEKTLEEIIQELRRVEETQEPIKQGFLSKFSDFLVKVPSVVSTLGQIFVAWITKNPPSA